MKVLLFCRKPKFISSCLLARVCVTPFFLQSGGTFLTKRPNFHRILFFLLLFSDTRGQSRDLSWNICDSSGSAGFLSHTGRGRLHCSVSAICTCRLRDSMLRSEAASRPWRALKQQQQQQIWCKHIQTHISATSSSYFSSIGHFGGVEGGAMGEDQTFCPWRRLRKKKDVKIHIFYSCLVPQLKSASPFSMSLYLKLFAQ